MNTTLSLFAASAMCCVVSSALASSDVRIIEDHGFVDIDLPFVVSDSSGDGIVRITAVGTIEGTDVGFELDFPSQSTSKSRAFLPIGVARFRSIGAPSNRFIAFLAKRYRVHAPAQTMLSSVDASVAGLKGDPQNVLAGNTEMKFFFFDNGPERRYAELFVTVDIDNHILEFHEKDPDYRKPLLLDFTKGS